MILKKIIIFLCLLSLLLISTQVVSAGVITGGVQTIGKQIYGTETPNSLQVWAALIIKTLLGLLGIIFVAMLIYGGFLYLTSQGNDQTIKKAKSVLTTAILGIVIIFIAYSIASFVLNVVINAQGTGDGSGGTIVNGGGVNPPPVNVPGEGGGGS